MRSAPSFVRGESSSQRSSFWSPKSSTTVPGFGIHRQNSISDIHGLLLSSLRGGSAQDLEDDATDVNENEENDDVDEEDEEDETETPEKVPAIASNIPVRLIISTNWGNSVIDQSVELTPARTRDIASIKKSLSKQLPGRPPMVSIDLVFEGRILEDETLVDELFEDDEEDEEDDDDMEEGNEPTRKLTINLVPPVDPKFATELGPKLVYRSDDDDDDYVGNSAAEDSISTDELVDAYYMNQVAMARNAQLLADPNSPSSPFLRMESQEQTRQLRDQLQSETPTEVWEKAMEVREEKSKGGLREEWRGQRYRSTKGGVSRQIKTIIQTNMNVDWEKTIQMCLLFLFLGYFGGKKSFSRQLLYWGAPLSFAVQSRPVKIWFKTIFHMQTILPSIFKSLLPAPALAILTLNMEKSCIELYGEDGAKIILGSLSSEAKGVKSESASTISEDDEEEDSDVDETDEDQDEYDSEEEDLDEEDYDSEDE